MGYINSGTTVNLVAKLTTKGREKLLKNTNTINYFSLGDSDANYNVSELLDIGDIPTTSGEYNSNSSAVNTITINSTVLVNSTGITKKNVLQNSNNVLIETVDNGLVTITDSDVTKKIIDRNTINGELNWLKSFNLPISSNDLTQYTGTTYSNGGYSDTCLNNLANDKYLIIGINNDNYGEILDGKSIKLDLVTDNGLIEIYSSYVNDGSKQELDGKIRDESLKLSNNGDNVVLLFSDMIQKPNTDNSLSWATGYNTLKPFSNNGKQLANFTTFSNLNINKDKIVGIAFLDKGFIVISDDYIINGFHVNDVNTTLTFKHLSNKVYQSVVCVCERGEFGASNNITYKSGDLVKISEIGLYDDLNNLIAIGKLDRHITKNINDYMALNIKIEV